MEKIVLALSKIFILASVIGLTACNPLGSSKIDSNFLTAAVPTISSVYPTLASLTGHETIRITGSSFNSSSIIQIGGSRCVTQTLESSTSIACVAPSHGSIEKVDVELVQPGQVTQTLTNGFSYGVVLGQPNLEHSMGLEYGLQTPLGVTICQGKVVLADSTNNRILIWNSIASTNQVKPDLVLGQPDLTIRQTNYNTLNSQSLNAPAAAFCDGTRLFVADTGNNRVLVWKTFPQTSYKAADLVLGQSDFSGNTANNGAISAHSMSGPSGVFSDGTRVVVSDTGNNRVLIWNNISAGNGSDANVILGQTLASTNTANLGTRDKTTLSGPTGVFGTSTQLFVSDKANNRVLIWTSWPTSNKQTANLQLGQTNDTTGTANVGGLSSQSLANPDGIYFYNGILYVSDSTNNRVSVWSALPTTDHQAASFILGQPTTSAATANNGGITGSSMWGPRALATDGTHLFVVDSNNSRLLQWNTIPTALASASIAYGQPDLIKGAPRCPPDGLVGKEFYGPADVFYDGTHLVVSDLSYKRVLIWNSLPTVNYKIADVVVGKTDFASFASATTSASVINGPSGAITIGSKLVVSDRSDNRVLIWNTIPTTNGVTADIVLGQTSMATTTANVGGAITAKTLSSPYNVASDGTNLMVSDQNNNRILIWPTVPTTTPQPAATYVLGQTSMTTGTANSPSVAAGMSNPRQLRVSDGRLALTELGNNRTTIWNSVPTASQIPADFAIGQVDLNSTAAGTAATISASVLEGGTVPFFANGKTYAGDGNRFLIFDPAANSSGAAATSVMGQTNFSAILPNLGGINGDSVNSIFAIYVYNDLLFIADAENSRLIIRPLP